MFFLKKFKLDLFNIDKCIYLFNLIYKCNIIDIVYDENDHKYGPTYITVNTIPDKRVLNTQLHMSPIQSRLKPISKTIKERYGSIIHRFELDGSAIICIRSTTASYNNIQRFSIRIDDDENDPTILLPQDNGSTSQKNINEHLTHMEKELQRITLAMTHVLKEADYNKDQDIIFHKQTLAMHNAITFWPIVQVCVLLITGFTQANHIVRFFKSRRIV